MYERNIYPTSMVLLPFFLFTVVIQQSSIAQNQDMIHQTCSPSSCGKITHISHPFRLKHDPPNCGDSSFELACQNNITVLYLDSVRYFVESINYNNFTIRLVDPGVQQTKCPFPKNSFGRYNLSHFNYSVYFWKSAIGSMNLFQQVIYLNCSNPVSDYPEYVRTPSCFNWNSTGHIYAIAGDITAERLKVDCRVVVVAATSLWGPFDDTHVYNESYSYTDIHRALVFGFELSWDMGVCKDYCGDDHCRYDFTRDKVECLTGYCYSPLGFEIKLTNCGKLSRQRIFAEEFIYGIGKGLLQIVAAEDAWSLSYIQQYNYPQLGYDMGKVIGHYMLPYITVRFLLGIIFLISLLTYTWRRRHFSVYGNIEEFLQGSNLMPIRYSYKEIKKMTRGFKDKLGEGGFGSVYKGKLRSGPFIAVKMLGKAKTNGQEFISEVATIGRIHHINVVKLVGFCFEGPKRALVYEYMLNGSLDKYIFSNEVSMSLSYEKMYKISIGVARGIAYLHQGCGMKILHFDIKPHNILLDENFIPKVSDFGLAKLYHVDDSIVTMTAARGTIGYMAPELFYHNIGRVSYKADVYSFGMLLMEMTSRRKNLNRHADHSSQLYFPFWIYDQFNEEKDLEMEDVTDEGKNIAKKMFLVALWCIQLKPCDRPSMSKVVEMLEGEIESIEMPPKPTLYPHETIAVDSSTPSSFTAKLCLTDCSSTHY